MPWRCSWQAFKIAPVTEIQCFSLNAWNERYRTTMYTNVNFNIGGENTYMEQSCHRLMLWLHLTRMKKLQIKPIYNRKAKKTHIKIHFCQIMMLLEPREVNTTKKNVGKENNWNGNLNSIIKSTLYLYPMDPHPPHFLLQLFPIPSHPIPPPSHRCPAGSGALRPEEIMWRSVWSTVWLSCRALVCWLCTAWRCFLPEDQLQKTTHNLSGWKKTIISFVSKPCLSYLAI